MYGSETTSSATCFADLAVTLHTLPSSPAVLPGNPGKHTQSPLISVILTPNLGTGKGACKAQVEITKLLSYG